ncbi:MAG: class II fructose-bisphosphate aldolase, partial [Anaerolineae bacterium]|nr:class II fructose-bisphosphate aldolase [Anaerolineae bacterium]
MPLLPISQMMQKAMHQGYAVGYFESWNIESLYGVIDAAEQSRSPIIIGFNGEFLSEPKRIAEERLSWYGALGRAAAVSASVPVGFIFNECSDDGWVRRAVTAGFNLVMPVPAHGETDAAYTDRVRAMVEFAHAHQVAVESELGTLPFGGQEGGSTTDPRQAAEFVAATGTDLLAISVGNIHVLLHGAKALDLGRVAALREVMDVPFVLHGGTGIDKESIKAAIALGVTKVNYGTFIKQHYLDVMRAALAVPETNPHKLLGLG